MLSFDEYEEIMAAINTLDGQFTDDVIEKGEYYAIEEDPVTLFTVVTIYDANGAAIASAKVEDMDAAIVYMEEVFELDPVELAEIDPVAAAVDSPWGHASAGNRSTN